jgi:hypothetical protein
MKARRAIQIAAPLVAIATLMVGLRVGGGDAVRAAVVWGAPAAKPPPGGKTRLAWQVLTLLEDRGVRETIAVPGLEVVARAKGQEARWAGATNADGVAEAALDFDGDPGDAIDLEVRAAGDPAPLARGGARAPADKAAGTRAAGDPASGGLRPQKREGAIALDVLIEGGRLVTGFPTPLWVHVAAPAGVSPESVTFEVEPEPGLSIDSVAKGACANGWAEIEATAIGHVVGASIVATAKAPQTTQTATGSWFGVLPVAAGAFQPNLPRVVPEATAATAVLVAPNPRTVVYAEVDDETGRAAAAALDVRVEPGDATPRARFDIPPLAAGLHWLVVSGEPRGGERLGGAAIARPFFVGPDRAACDVGPWLAQHPAPGPGFPRWIALDGFPSRSANNRTKHRLGMLIALVSLVAAAILEMLLLSSASREARIELQLAELDEDAPAEKVTAKPPGGGLAVGLLVAVLGFALLAALLVMKS